MFNDLLMLNKIRGGDIKAFEDIFRSNYSPLLFFATSITGRMDVAEEIIQDLFYVLWKERENLHVIHSLKAYLYGAVKNRSLQYCEHQKIVEKHVNSVKATELDITTLDPLEILESKELEEIIQRTMDNMPERRMEIFRMHRFEGRKYMEIADLLSLSVKTVEAEISKALKTLRKEIEFHTSILL